MRTRRAMIALVVAIAVVAAACTSNGDSAAPETTTTVLELPELEFSRGVVPASVPASWPTPEQAVVGATMIDGTRRLTEMILTYPASVADVSSYYTTNLPVLGYQLSSVSGSDGTVDIEFAGNGVSGTIVLTTGGTTLSAGTIRMVHE